MRSVAVVILSLVSVALSSCQDNSSGAGGAGEEESRPILAFDVQEDDADVPLLSYDVPDADVVDAAPEPPTCLGQPIQCCQTQYWYCPEGFVNDELWRIETMVNICDENGEPCEPQHNDDSCIWQIVQQGECEKVFDCNPMGDIDLGTQPCQIEGEDGEILHGEQQVFCNKGHTDFGPCIPCVEEICDGIDNDCDGTTDEGDYPCSSECGDGLGLCVEGEIVFCDAPVSSPEVCDNLDNDCDGETDEELVQACETVCEAGLQFCIEGDWSNCTAQPPLDEVCDGMDNDCDGLTDESLDCQCPPETVGMLIPCMEDPLVCGQGFKSCQCSDNDCTQTEMSPCLAMCSWLPPDPAQVCDPFLGIVMDEVCNAFDDNCNQLIDEDLTAVCYTGPEGTEGVGVCHAGEMVCEMGQWGSFNDGAFMADVCADEKTPLEEDLCSGQDDNCDGIIENVMEETDVLFIVDTSGSMSSTINAVQQAMTQFAANYADQQVIQWGLVVGPLDHEDGERLMMSTNLVPFAQFLPVLQALDDDSTGSEMLYDALFLSIRNLVAPGDVPNMPPLHWDDDDISSSPTIQNWNVNWREDANHVVIVFSDEKGQSYTHPEITQAHITQWAAAADDLAIYTFSKPQNKLGNDGWGPVAVNGAWSKLTSNGAEMFGALMDIIDEEACGGGAEEQGAMSNPVPLLWNPIDEEVQYAHVGHAICTDACFVKPVRPWRPEPRRPEPIHPQLVLYAPIYSWEELVCLPGWPR